MAFRRALREAVVNTEHVLLEKEHAVQYPELFETLPMLMSRSGSGNLPRGSSLECQHKAEPQRIHLPHSPEHLKDRAL